jgi:hypothetical protein
VVLIASVSYCARDLPAQEVDKGAILEEWRREIQPVEEDYANCRIKAWDFIRLKPEDEKLGFHRSVQFFGRGELQRLDIQRFELYEHRISVSGDDIDVSIYVSGKPHAFRVQRRKEHGPFTLLKRFRSDDNEDGYANPKLMIDANFAPANGAFAIWGNEVVEFLSAKPVQFLKDEHPDPKRPNLRRFTCRSHEKPERPALEGWFTIDEARRWVLVEWCWGKPGQRAIVRFFYDEDNSDIPRLVRTESLSEKDGQPVSLVWEWRVKELRFEPPDENLFTLAAFGIPEDAPEEADKFK